MCKPVQWYSVLCYHSVILHHQYPIGQLILKVSYLVSRTKHCDYLSVLLRRRRSHVCKCHLVISSVNILHKPWFPVPTPFLPVFKLQHIWLKCNAIHSNGLPTLPGSKAILLKCFEMFGVDGRRVILKVILSLVEGSHLLTPSVCLFDIGVVCFYNMTGIRPIIINDHQSSSIIINDLQSSSMIINHHQSSSMIMPPS